MVLRFLLISFFVTTALGEDTSLSSESIVDRAIAAYRPVRLPTENELAGLIVVIDPIRSTDPAARRPDEMCLMTAEHLYHLVRSGGGVSVLTRADDQPVPGSDAGLDAAVRAQLACVKGHVLLRIECGSQTRVPAAEGAASPLTSSLVAALSSTVSTQPLNAFKIPACTVMLTAVESSDAFGDRLRHREWAGQLYRALATFASVHRDDLNETRSAAFDGPLPASCQSVPLEPSLTPEQKRETLARQIWPEGSLPLERLDWFCQMYAKLRLSNRTLIHFEPRGQREGTVVSLTGATTDRRLATGLVNVLRLVGIEAEDRMRLLPDERALDHRLFGACKATMARTFAEPSESAPPQTQALYGDPLVLLDRREGHYLVQAGDGYWGWIRQEAVEPMTREQFTAYISPQLGILLTDIVHESSVLRRGTRLPVRRPNESNRAEAACTLILPEGNQLSIPPAQVKVLNDLPDARDRVTGALDLLYTPYVYGARSPIGLDCSGMVAYLGELTGQAPARDAAQQALAGRLVATRWYRDAITAGDLLYFMDEGGKISHTGIALNATHFIHASPPEVQISSLKAGDRLYSAHWDSAFFVAKRP